MRALLVAVAALAACGGGSSPGGGPGQPDAPPATQPDAPPVAQPDAPPATQPDAPAAGTPGTPTGVAVTKLIGASGGQLASADSAFTVDVPAGALAADTMLSVQPITVTAPGGVGKTAWRLGPEGKTFAQPLTLKVKLPSTAGLDFGSAQLATMPSTGGTWTALASTRDQAAGTVTASTTHFSDFVLYSTLILDPTEAQARLGGQVHFSTQYCALPAADGPTGPCFSFLPTGSAVWSVESQSGGAGLGTIKFDDPHYMGDATYTAPMSAPPGSVDLVKLTWTNGQKVAIAIATVKLPSDSWGGSVDETFVTTGAPGQTLTWTSHATVEFLPGTQGYVPSGNIDLTVDLVDNVMGCTGHATGNRALLDSDGLLSIFAGQYYSGLGVLMTDLVVSGSDNCTPMHVEEPMTTSGLAFTWWAPVTPPGGLPYFTIKTVGGAPTLQESLSQVFPNGSYDVSWTLTSGK